jgi:hypothetical protein
VHPGRIEVANVENFEITIGDKRLFRDIMGRRRRSEPVKDFKADRELVC